jgi:YegS/Rv2252/BmrU family lipid kinase
MPLAGGFSTLARVPAATLAIVNPRSGAGVTGRRWARVFDRLREALGPLEVEQTRAPRDAVRIAREAARAGVERLIVAGGDGTTSEVATGVLAAGLGERVELGLLPLGSGCDFARGLGVPRDPEVAIENLARGVCRRIDAGRISYRGRSGEAREAYFLNVASVGVSGLVDELVNQAGKSLGPTLAFVLGSLRAIRRYRSPDATVRVDGAVVHSGSLTLVAAANGRFFGSGMRIAPDAALDDGLFDVVVVAGLSKPKLVARLPSLYSGAHLRHTGVCVHRGRRVEVDLLSGSSWIDVDGEPLGSPPVTIELLPGSIRLFGLPVAAASEAGRAA